MNFVGANHGWLFVGSRRYGLSRRCCSSRGFHLVVQHLSTNQFSLGGSRLVSDAHEHDIGGCPAGNICHCVHVDCRNMISLNAATTSQVSDEGTSNVGRVDLKSHGHVLSSVPVTVLGNLLDGTAKETRVTPKKWWRALTSVLQNHLFSRRALEVLLGHLTFVGLTNRRQSCVFDSCCKFIQLHSGSVKRLEETWLMSSGPSKA